MIQTLASSETGTIAGHRITEADCHGDGPLPVGRAVPGVRLLLRDEGGAEITDDRIGEIVVEGVSPIYWTGDSAAAPPDPGGGFRTGDLGRWRKDGCLLHAGRADDRVKIRGHRVHLGEIEAAMRSLPGVMEAVVLARRRDDGGHELAGFVVGGGHGEPLSAGAIRARLRSRLPEAMVPSLIREIDAIPLTPNGKVNREGLLAELEPPATTGAPVGGEAASACEVALAAMWTKVLGGFVVGRGDDFYSLGGDSLAAAVVGALVHAEWGVELTLQDFSQHPRLEELARRIEAIRASGEVFEVPDLEPAPRDRPPPLSFAQERLWRYSRDPAASVGYHVSMRYVIRGALEIEVFRSAIERIFERHEILRTGFEEGDDGPVQVVRDRVGLDFEFRDLAGESDPDAAAEAWFRAEAGRPFDLASPPLLRFRLARVGEETHQWLRVGHHLISDGWSWRIFFEELEHLYESGRRREPSVLEDLPLQYGDYAAWEQRVLRRDSDSYRRMVDRWLSELPAEAKAIELPFRRTVPDDSATAREGLFWWGLEPGVTSALDALAGGCGVSPYAARLAALTAVLAEAAGQDDFVIGAYVSNRPRLEIQRMFGLFINLVTLRFRCDPAQPFRQWMVRVNGAVVAAQSRAAIPYEQLVEEFRGAGMVPPEIRMIFNRNAGVHSVRLGEAELVQPERRMETMPWGFSVTMDPANESTGCRVDFDARLHDPRGVRSLVSRFAALLDEVTRRPDAPLSGLIAAASGRECPDFGSDHLLPPVGDGTPAATAGEGG